MYRLRLAAPAGSGVRRCVDAHRACVLAMQCSGVLLCAACLLAELRGGRPPAVAAVLEYVVLAGVAAVAGTAAWLARRAAAGTQLHWVAPDGEKVARPDATDSEVHDALLQLV